MKISVKNKDLELLFEDSKYNKFGISEISQIFEIIRNNKYKKEDN